MQNLTFGAIVETLFNYSFRLSISCFMLQFFKYKNSYCVKHLALFSLLLRVKVARATVVEQLIAKLILFNRQLQEDAVQLDAIEPAGQNLMLVSQQLQKQDSENSLSRPLHMLYFSTQNN